ncbi:hypothetical protein C0995_003839 [Termitomyces sp. Mi166|nr:hypothetical protein C0995_003839 [Termitomyces sp. Mi166\
MNRSPALPMSHIIAHDAPLLSPTADPAPWDPLYSPNDPFGHYCAPSSPSSSSSDPPTPASRVLRMRMSPDAQEADQQQLCFPTHQVFPEQVAPTASQKERLSISINPAAVASSVAAKRTATPPTSLPKKPRATVERINSKDFIPPDVSGLSKREARLVKNRAAAFLSRQRKREEFELMEVRVAELEQENARLLALTQNGSAASQGTSGSRDQELLSQIEDLKAQLASAQVRERRLIAELAKSKANVSSANKVDQTADSQLPLSTRSSATKSGASLGLMVLLCALPTLLSMPMKSALPRNFLLPNAPLPAAPAAFDFNSLISNDHDWSRAESTMMDLDDLDMSTVLSSSAPTSQKLEFSTSGVSADADNALGGLDISFDTVPVDNGKIRVRIHPSSAVSSRAASPGFSDYKSEISSPLSTESEHTIEAAFLSSSSSSSSSPALSLSSSSPSSYLAPPSPAGDPFFGVGAAGYSMPYSSDMSDMFRSVDDSLSGVSDLGQDVGFGSEFSTDNVKRRVRIALKSMPAAGGEGGEWEVQIC